jgi:hypothetical protein
MHQKGANSMTMAAVAFASSLKLGRKYAKMVARKKVPGYHISSVLCSIVQEFK